VAHILYGIEFALVDTLLASNPIGAPFANRYYRRVNYRAYLRSERWRRTREKRLRIDRYKCTKCQSPFRLQVHHKTYERRGNENPRTDLVTLCAECHENEHREKIAAKRKGKRNDGH
jgi:5-methylcytosine-specific restriction endonuclease McrA